MEGHLRCMKDQPRGHVLAFKKMQGFILNLDRHWARVGMCSRKSGLDKWNRSVKEHLKARMKM